MTNLNNFKKEWLTMLNLMLKDMETAPQIYRPTNFWSSVLNDVVSVVQQYGLESFRNESAINYFVPHYTEAEKKYYIDPVIDYRLFMAADKDIPPYLQNVSESSVGNPSQHYEVHGKYFSRSMLNYLRGLTYLKKLVDTSRIHRVLEIGGGYGTLGEIFLKSNSTDYFYLDIDIPPVAYIATRYLQAVFGRDTVADYTQSRDLPVIDIDYLSETYKAAVLATWQIPKITGKVDLFVNFFSFQEMEPKIVENYAAFVTQCNPEFILLRNQRTGKELASEPGQVGVIQPTTREHYLNFFSNYTCIGCDAEVFGCVKDGFESEVLIMKRA
jgi:putative sugar O-methyltransferase